VAGGQVVDACVLDRVMAPIVALLAALPEQADDDLDGLLEHLQAQVGLRPAVAEDMHVERLARADAEREAALVHDAAGRGRLGDDRRVDAHGGHVTPVVTGRLVASASAPITDHTNAL
jgi:hypothetical protein